METNFNFSQTVAHSPSTFSHEVAWAILIVVDITQVSHRVGLHVGECAVLRDGVQRLGRKALAQEPTNPLHISSQVLRHKKSHLSVISFCFSFH